MYIFCKCFFFGGGVVEVILSSPRLINNRLGPLKRFKLFHLTVIKIFQLKKLKGIYYIQYILLIFLRIINFFKVNYPGFKMIQYFYE